MNVQAGGGRKKSSLKRFEHNRYYDNVKGDNTPAGEH